MLMNLLASAVLFLFIGPFNNVSSRETEAADSIILQVTLPQHVFVAVNEALGLNCTISGTTHGLHPTQLLWKHNNTWMPNASYVVDNNTIQLKISRTQYEDAGVYRCAVFLNSSQFQNASSRNVTVVVGDKPVKPKSITISNVLGKPVQELTLQWPAQVNLTYELFVGRVPRKGYPFCEFNKMAISTQTLRGQHGLLTYHVKREVLGQLFHWIELTKFQQCGNQSILMHRCDTFCAYVVAKNAFGTSDNSNNDHLWNLILEARCPPPHNLSVSLGEGSHNNMTVRWQHPLLVQENYTVFYYLSYNITPVLTKTMLQTIHLRSSTEVYHAIEVPEPFAEYSFALNCCLWLICDHTHHGPAVYTQVTSKEKAPSVAPKCQVENRTIHGDAYILLKPPQKTSWNGIPRKYVIYYDNGEQQKVINQSLNGLHADRTLGVWLNHLDPRMNYSVRATLCTGGGCGEILSQPCFINEVTEDSGIDTQASASTGETQGHKGVKTWIAIASGLFSGIILVAVFIAYLTIKRQRSRRKKQEPLAKILCSLLQSNSHDYENALDDGPSMCQESEYYHPILTAPLLKDMDCTVANFPVSKL